MRRLLLPLLGLALLAPAADAATTYKDVAYSVDFAGMGTYEKLDSYDLETDFWHTETTDIQFTFEGQINDGVVFRDGHPFDVHADDLSTGTVVGSYEVRSGAGGDSCPAADEDPSHGWMRFTEPELDPLTGETELYLRPFDAFDVSFDCGGSTTGVSLVQPWDLDGQGNVPPGGHQFDITFSLPPEVFGMGYIQQIIPAQVFTGDRCPHFYDHATTECRMEWSGKVILRKLWEKTVTSDGTYQPPSLPPGQEHLELAPLTPPAPPKPPAKPPVADDDDFLVPLVEPSSAKVDASGKTATVTVTCGGGCSGTASVIAGGASARAAAAKPLASAKFRVPAGKRKTRVRVKLGTKARRALRRARSAKLRLSFTRPTRRTQTIALKLPR